MKRTIRLTESDLQNVIKESVKRILSEGMYDDGGLDFVAGGDGSDFTINEIKELARMLMEHPVEETWKPQYYGFCQVQRVEADQTPGRMSLLSRDPYITYAKTSNNQLFIQIGRKPNTHWLDNDGYTYMAWK